MAFYFPNLHETLRNHKGPISLEEAVVRFSNHIGSILTANTSGRGAPLSPRARCPWSFVSPSFLIDYTRTIFHSTPGFAGHSPNAAPPHPVLFSEPQMASAHTSVLSKQSAQTTPEGSSDILASPPLPLSVTHFRPFMYITCSRAKRTLLPTVRWKLSKIRSGGLLELWRGE